jgi:hypothetical protein
MCFRRTYSPAIRSPPNADANASMIQALVCSQVLEVDNDCINAVACAAELG